MRPKSITSSTLALIVAALLLLGVGIYTDNRGFQLAGGLVPVVSLFLSFSKPTHG